MAKMQFKPALSQDDQTIIKQLSLDPNWTDEKIANKIGCSIETVRKYRKKFGISKANSSITVLEDGMSKDTINKANISEDQKLELWTKLFRKSNRFKRLQKQLLPEDLEYFTELWASYCMQFDDLKPSEEEQLEILVTHKLRIHHLRQDYYDAQLHEDELKKLLKDENGNNKDLSLENEADRWIWETIESHSRVKQDLNKSLMELTKETEKYFKMLNSTREQREQKEQIGAETFTSLVISLTDQMKREEVGKYNEYMKLATQKKMQEFKQPHEFADKNIEPIIMEGIDFQKAQNNE